MPTPISNFRIPKEVKDHAVKVAKQRNTTLTKLIVDCLKRLRLK